ncbi:hypothetical protein ACD661_10010 [Legionella lytica]|uniref:Transmembrane protein n=1 Tax=Legionella lytica TaxID=96232 RepID=A0ABW8DCA3_9GAMM
MADSIIDNAKGPVRAEDVLIEAGYQAFGGALGGGIIGTLGKFTGSFFAPGLVQGAGGFMAFAGVGALAALLKWLPDLLTRHYIENNAFLKEHPHLQEMLKNCSGLAYWSASVAASAALVGSPVGPTLACMTLLPLVFSAVEAIVCVINALIEQKIAAEEESPAFA